MSNSPNALSGKRVAILVENGFEQVEMTEPRHALTTAGATTDIISPQSDQVKGWNHTDWGERVPVDARLDEVAAEDFDALLLPGGQMNPDALRLEDRVLELIEDFDDADKPIAAICHGPWLLVEADIVDGRTVTGWPSIRTDLENAGGDVVDKEVAVDGNLITSRKPDDIPAFSKALIEALS